jgi:hypothetical protein
MAPILFSVKAPRDSLGEACERYPFVESLTRLIEMLDFLRAVLADRGIGLDGSTSNGRHTYRKCGKKDRAFDQGRRFLESANLCALIAQWGHYVQISTEHSTIQNAMLELDSIPEWLWLMCNY